MNRYTEVLKNTSLFTNVTEAEIGAMLQCLDASLKYYKKGECVFLAGDRLRNLMILVDGELHIQKDDYWGNRSLVNRISAGEMVGESYLAPDSGALLNDIVAVENSVIVFFDINRIFSLCSSACRFHSTVVRNLFFAVSEKNRMLVTKLGHISNRTTRDKLLSYLSDESKRQGSSSFAIPFDRQQLADFLSVDRSAMSRELCKMRDEGMLEFNRNRFALK